jgi:hypothetical protein
MATMRDPSVKDEIRAEPAIGAACESPLSLVNPATGLANDYLNIFNEILLVLEFLPSMPEMTDEALAWQPRSYCEYYEESSLPGARQALQAYDRVDPVTRSKFEAILARLIEIVVQAQQRLAVESGRPEYPDSIAKSCEQTAEAMRVGLSYVSRLINEGLAPTRRTERSPKSSKERNLSHG